MDGQLEKVLEDRVWRVSHPNQLGLEGMSEVRLIEVLKLGLVNNDHVVREGECGWSLVAMAIVRYGGKVVFFYIRGKRRRNKRERERELESFPGALLVRVY